MVVSALINSIDYVKKTCTVLIPDLQSSADPEPVIREAALLESLGTQNSYKVGDKVWVSFIRNEKRYPIVLGRILTTDTDYINQAGGGNFTELAVSEKMTLPANTVFNVSAINAEYNSLENIINKIKQLYNFYDVYYKDMINIQNNSIRYAAYCSEESKPTYSIGTMVFVKLPQLNTTDETSDFIDNTYTLYSSNHTLYLVEGLSSTTAKEFALDVEIPSTAIALDGKWQIQAIMTGAVIAQRIE